MRQRGILLLEIGLVAFKIVALYAMLVCNCVKHGERADKYRENRSKRSNKLKKTFHTKTTFHLYV